MNVITADLLSEIDFINHGFFDRTGGESKGSYESLNVGIGRGDDDKIVLKNREKIAKHFGIPVSNLIILNQKHGNKVHIIDSKNKKDYQFKDVEQALKNEGDAIITKEKGLLIAVNTADCAPILLCDKDQKYIAVIHAGWRGSNGTIIENTLKEMKNLGCKNIMAAIGPCLKKKHFEVKDDVALKVDSKYISYIENKSFFDMQLQVLEKLMKNGAKVVSKLNIDTFSDENYFSYRRIGEKTGVQFSGIVIKG